MNEYSPPVRLWTDKRSDFNDPIGYGSPEATWRRFMSGAYLDLPAERPRPNLDALLRRRPPGLAFAP